MLSVFPCLLFHFTEAPPPTKCRHFAARLNDTLLFTYLRNFLYPSIHCWVPQLIIYFVFVNGATTNMKYRYISISCVLFSLDIESEFPGHLVVVFSGASSLALVCAGLTTSPLTGGYLSGWGWHFASNSRYPVFPIYQLVIFIC